MRDTVAGIFVLGHIHTFYIHDFQRLSDERREKRRQEREERALDEAIEKIGEVKINFFTCNGRKFLLKNIWMSE